MAIEIKRNGSIVAYLEENVNGKQGLDLYIFDTKRFGPSGPVDAVRKVLGMKRDAVSPATNEKTGGLEAQLVYSPHLKCEDGRRLVTGLVTEASNKVFTTDEYLASLKKEYWMSLETVHGPMIMETKRDEVKELAGIRDKIYANGDEAANLAFRYHPKRTRLLRAGIAVVVGSASAAMLYFGQLPFEPPWYGLGGGEIAINAGLTYVVSNWPVKWCLPLFMRSKSLLLDIKAETQKAEACEQELSGHVEFTKANETKLSIVEFERRRKKEAVLEQRKNILQSHVAAMTQLLPDIYSAICNSDGLHVSYRSPAGKSVDDVANTMRSLVPSEKP